MPFACPTMSASTASLPADLQFIERGWLSANNTVFVRGITAVVDTGYCSHAEQTVGLVEASLQGAPLQRIVRSGRAAGRERGEAIG